MTTEDEWRKLVKNCDSVTIGPADPETRCGWCGQPTEDYREVGGWNVCERCLGLE